MTRFDDDLNSFANDRLDDCFAVYREAADYKAKGKRKGIPKEND